MVDLLDEMKDEMRREWWLNFWRRVGGYFVAGSVAIIVVTVATVAYQKIQKDKQLDSSESFLAAQELSGSKSYSDAAVAFEALAEKAPKGMAALARIQEARAKFRAGEHDEAAAAMRALVDDSAQDIAIREMATLDLAGMMVSDGKDYADLENLLSPLAESRQSKFASLAKEALAMAALDAGKRDDAERMLMEVSTDAATPATQRERVKNMLSALNPNRAVPAEAAAAPAEKAE